ncbi:acetyl esterase [Deinococcus carri]|uniref:Acetyl esterase n=1 Tax=Deinococcus carri TaxID=1211323 RepID=A0ABP9WDD8_9DEIO
MTMQPSDVAVTVRRIPAPHHTVPVRIFRPSTARSGWLVWAHGGSWVSGSAAAWHAPCLDLARRAGVTLVSVDYRLAPAHPYPVPLEDVLAVLVWAAQQPELQADPRLLAVGGDSAGATLAASSALAFRDQGRLLGGQVLAYPPLDPQCRAPSYTWLPHQFPNRDSLMAAWRAYAGPGQPSGRAQPYLSPLQAKKLDGVAPAILGVGGFDPVRDDVRRYAARLRLAGVPVQLREFAGEGHALFMAPSTAFRRWLAASVRQQFDEYVNSPMTLPSDARRKPRGARCPQP